MGKLSNRAGDEYPSGAIVAQTCLKDNGGSGSAEGFDVGSFASKDPLEVAL
jgi:hypothetical protein